MAVELRCPKCRAKLRLADNPDPDSEIECPKCGKVFPCDENIVHAGAEEAAPAKKQSPPAEKAKKDDKPAKKAKKGVKTQKDQVAKKKRMKKRKTSPVVLVSIIVGALMLIGAVSTVLIWYVSKKSAGQEMMSYLPADCDEVVGVNVGHLQKYFEFYRICEGKINPTGFKQAADVFSKAIGQETKDTLDYVIQGTGSSVGATVLKTKMEFDPGLLSKIPDGTRYATAGVNYYTIPEIGGLGYPSLRVFAPTNRLVVFCRGDMPDAQFKAMLNGNRDSFDKTAYSRSGELGKQVSRGTVWRFTLYGRSFNKPSGGGGGEGGNVNPEAELHKQIADILSAAQGYGIKASVGARDVRGELTVLYKDSDTASNMYKKCKETDWIKDVEKPTPRWFENMARTIGAGKTSANILKDGLGFSSSGNTFSIRSSVDTKNAQQGMGPILEKFKP